MRSFKYAFNGLWVLFQEEHNARVHLLITAIALACAVVLRISAIEWLFVLGSIAYVFSMELLNSSIEALCDRVCPEKDARIGKAKDMAAAAVLIGAITAAVIGSIIFIPKLLALWSEF